MSVNHKWGMKRATLDKWLKALESGSYRQIYSWGDRSDSECCVLGVLGSINRELPYQDNYASANQVISKTVKNCNVHSSEHQVAFTTYFIAKNDREKLTFPQLAIHIRDVVKPIDEL